jgi:hypothetical protein
MRVLRSMMCMRERVVERVLESKADDVVDAGEAEQTRPILKKYLDG